MQIASIYSIDKVTLASGLLTTTAVPQNVARREMSAAIFAKVNQRTELGVKLAYPDD